MIKRERRCALAFLTAICLLYPCSRSYGSENGTWDLSENGKQWMYFYSPGNPAEDEWVEYEGKEYYVDSKGYMKTGWVTDKRDGNKYYMGEDGAKCFNMFTPDDHYVGPEGIILKYFDTYRKAVKKQLTSVIKDKKYKDMQSSGLPGFLLTDLNGDGYMDVVVVNRVDNPKRIALVSVWDTEEEKMVLSAEADLEGAEDSRISYNPQTQTTWLVIDAGNGWDKDYFEMDENGSFFENVWHFTAEPDDWGDPEYYINGQKSEPDEWNQAVSAAEEDAGNTIEGALLPLDEEHIKQAVDRAPGMEELPLWQP